MVDVNVDHFYAAAADHFRGEVADIRRHVEGYLHFIDEAGAGTPEAPVLDIGCGRGEWLAALRDHHKLSYGIDLSDAAIDRCSRQGLPVTKADAIVHLEATPPGSLGAITGFHLIEHLTPDDRIAFALLALRCLRPGGVLILETPNPENLRVACVNFYFDQTHVCPIPALFLDFLLRYAGFDVQDPLYMAPTREGGYLPGWSPDQDYAIIAHRPVTQERQYETD